MSNNPALHNSVRARREALGWSQQDLAARAGISRSAVSAIEMRRLVPSAAAALALAHTLNCRVEDLFRLGGAVAFADAAPCWAWPPPTEPCRYWKATVGGRTLRYPVEPTADPLPHDGVFAGGAFREHSPAEPGRALVLATCDPAAGLLAAVLRQSHSLRVLVFSRSSGKALRLLREGVVHAAGVHLAHAGRTEANRQAAAGALTAPHALLHVARWQEGIAFDPRLRFRSVRGAVRGRGRWVGRESGAGARQCLEELLGSRPAPRRTARDHRGVAEAIRSGWADLGVCLRLAGEEAGLAFLPVREESYDFCFRAETQDDPRVAALIAAVRSPAYRRLLGELPGYDVRETGKLEEAP